jgi:hypothetical protein
VCGVCTRACSSDSACDRVSADSRCSEPASTQYASACQSGAPEKICVRAPNAGASGAAIRGMPFDTAANCYGAEELAGFGPQGADGDCFDVQTVAVAPGGACWLFPTTCLPDGFTDAGENPLLDPPPCRLPEINVCPAALSCSAGEAPTVRGCLSCTDARRELISNLREYVIRAELDTCTFDTNCVAESWEAGCDGQCPLAINRGSVDTFRSQAPALVRGYCSDPAQWRASCGQNVVDCNDAPLCRRGRCVISTLPCDQRELADCESDGDCALTRAYPFDDTTQCFTFNDGPVACVDPDFTCPSASSSALDADGNCFLFNDCVPQGFRRAPAEHPCSAGISAICAP